MVVIRNKDRLLRKLGALSPRLKGAITEGNRESAHEMVALAKDFVPVKTGKLRESIVATGPGQTTPSYSAGGAMQVPDGAYAVTAGDRGVRTAHLIEYGTKPHINAGKFAMTQHPGTRAQPFFWPAYRFIRRKMRARISKALGRAIKEFKAR